MSALTGIRTETAPLSSSVRQVCNRSKKALHVLAGFPFSPHMFHHLRRHDDTNLYFGGFSNWLHWHVRWRLPVQYRTAKSWMLTKDCSCFYTNFTCRQIFIWIWTILSNALVPCSIPGCRKRCFTRLKTAPDWRCNYRRMLKVFSSQCCTFSKQFD